MPKTCIVLTEVELELVRCQEEQLAQLGDQARDLEAEATAKRSAARVLRQSMAERRRRCLDTIGRAHDVTIPDGAALEQGEPQRLCWGARG